MTHTPVSFDTSLSFDLVVPSLSAPNEKQLLKNIAREISKLIGLKERILLDRLIENEKDHPSAIGDGIALTHLQMGGLQSALNIFVRLKTPCAMSTPDNKDIDLFCILLTPAREGSSYLRTMARISRLLRNAQICSRLRSAVDEKDLRNILEQSSNRLLAA